jgi:phosphatidylserine/phosphatidylglycerophosphate/cardiolipin synthase-like enzyme
MNIGREYRYDWHDLMVRVEGDVVKALARDSDDAWAKSGMLGDLAALFRYFRSPKPFTTADGYPIRILYTRAQHSSSLELKKQLPAGPGYRLAEAVADIFL